MIAYDPMIGIIAGGDLNKIGLKELAPRMEQYGLKAIFGPRAVTHDRGNHLDEVYTNLKLKWKSIETTGGLSDHYMLLCEVVVNPRD
jgi:hypothetical protein